MSGDRREHDLAAFLAEDGGELGRLYRKLPRPEPPRRLDRAILAEAARAVRGADTRRRPRQRWLLGLGSVAGVVLAAGIAWQVQRENGPGTVPVAQPAAPPGVISVEPIMPPPAEPVPSPQPPAPVAPSAQSAAASAKAGAPARQEPPHRAAAEPVTVQAERKIAPEPAAAPPPPPADTAPKTEAADAAADAKPQVDGAAAAAARGEAPAENAARARNGTVASPAPITSTELRRNMRLPPDRWLDEIRRLQRDGQHHWAGENLRLFRRVHPRRAIPADLQPLLDD